MSFILKMLQLLAQAVTGTVTPTPTPTPTITTEASDMASFLKTTVTSLIGIDVFLGLKVVAVWVLLVWLIFAFWVAIDALQRYRNPLFALFWFVFVLPFNLFGFIGYLFIRPALTLEEKEWTKLEAKYLMYELSTVNDCPSCKTIVPNDSNYCPVCGYQMKITCKNCGNIQSIYNGFCTSCGGKIKTMEEVAQARKASTATQQPATTKTTSATPVVTQTKENTVLTEVQKGLTGAVLHFTSKFKKMQPEKKDTTMLDTDSSTPADKDISELKSGDKKK